MKEIRTKLRHRLIYRGLHLIAPLLLRKYDFSTDRLSGLRSTIIMANHLTEVDMLMIMAAFRDRTLFVAGEHVLRTANGRLIDWAQGPIYRFKGGVAIDTIREIVDHIQAGHNVMLFPEGSRSFSGETEQLPESVGKLVRMAKGGLVTYHIEGGYFVAPRWAYTTRTGPMKGRIVNSWTPGEIAGMSSREITAAVNRDLYENAYLRQRKNRYKYTGERLAEGMENYLVKCPCCGAFDSLITKGNTFRCGSCGMSGIYTEEGFLTGRDLKFDSVYDWGKWAEAETEAYIRERKEDAVCFRDEGVRLYEITPDHREISLSEGAITGWRDHIEACGRSFAFRGMRGVSMLYFGKTLLFTSEGRHYGITGEQFHAIKYSKLYDVYSD